MAENELAGIKVAILATDGFEESELTDPRNALQTAGATADVISLASGKIQGWFWKSEVPELAKNVGPTFPTVGALLEAMDTVHASTRAFIEGFPPSDLGRTLETPSGPETVHHTLWYAREHTIHHRAQLFFRMRLAGRTPPEI